MGNGLLHVLKSTVNKSLAPVGIRIEKLDDHAWDDTSSFIPFERTMASARSAGLSVGDYVDAILNRMPGSSQSTIDKMAAAGVFSAPLETIVEIGPGTGRYLEKTIHAARPKRYEIYETARPWADYLMETYDLVLQRTDGYSLGDTASASADLVHAHKVFSSVPFMVTCCYWREIARAVRPGGWVAFDIMTERCLEGDAMEKWASSGIRNGAFPAVIPRALATEFFGNRGFKLAASHIVPMQPGTTELLVFRHEGPKS